MAKDTSTTQTAERKKANRAPRTVSPTQLLLSGQQVEATFGIPYRSVYDLHLRQVLPAVRFPGGKRLWFKRSDIETLIANSQVLCA